VSSQGYYDLNHESVRVTSVNYPLEELNAVMANVSQVPATKLKHQTKPAN